MGFKKKLKKLAAKLTGKSKKGEGAGAPPGTTPRPAREFAAPPPIPGFPAPAGPAAVITLMNELSGFPERLEDNPTPEQKQALLLAFLTHFPEGYGVDINRLVVFFASRSSISNPDCEAQLQAMVDQGMLEYFYPARPMPDADGKNPWPKLYIVPTPVRIAALEHPTTKPILGRLISACAGSTAGSSTITDVTAIQHIRDRVFEILALGLPFTMAFERTFDTLGFGQVCHSTASFSLRRGLVDLALVETLCGLAALGFSDMPNYTATQAGHLRTLCTELFMSTGLTARSETDLLTAIQATHNDARDSATLSTLFLQLAYLPSDRLASITDMAKTACIKLAMDFSTQATATEAKADDTGEDNETSYLRRQRCLLAWMITQHIDPSLTPDLHLNYLEALATSYPPAEAAYVDLSRAAEDTVPTMADTGGTTGHGAGEAPPEPTAAATEASVPAPA